MRLSRWLLQCLLLVAVWSLSASAFAQAPMCDPTGATVMAPLPAPPSDDGEIAALGCVLGGDRVEQLVPGMPSQPAGQVHFAHDEWGCLSLTVAGGWEAQEQPAFDTSVSGVKQPAHCSGVFRPPRSN